MNEIENPMATDHPDHTQADQILESLRPRMHSARVAHFRRLAAGVAVVPLLGFGAAAMAAGGESTGTEIETAVASPDDDAADLPEIGEGEATEVDVVPAEEVVVDTTTSTTTSTTTTAAPDPDAPKDIDLGALGWIEVKPSGDVYEVVSSDLTAGWEVINAEVVDGSLALLVSDGEVMKVVVIEPGPRDEILVSVDEFVPPTTTTTTVKPVVVDDPKDEPVDEPKDEPAPAPIVDRFTVEVPGKGSFVVEREGETLFVGNVTAADGFTAEVHNAEGWKVYVGFSNGETVFFGKALINDNGEVEQHFWEEQIGPQPVYEYVYVDGVGLAKFEAYDGQIRVYRTEAEEGFTVTDHFGGASASTGKVTFEGNGQLWTVDGWLDEAGTLKWSISQG